MKNNEYYGRNTKTDYAKTRINSSIFYILYSLLGIGVGSYGFGWMVVLIYRFYSKIDASLPIGLLFVLAFILLFGVGILITAVVVNTILIVRNAKVISYYKHNPLINVKEMVIPYDYKLWLTAVKDTFHPMSFNYDYNGETNTYKTAIIFTNNSTYYKLPKFKMPEALMAKNYINNYGIVGYDQKNNEPIVIGFTRYGN